jgi:predicted N-acyltransferase
MSYPYLTAAFFEQIFSKFRHRIVLCMARRDGVWIAGAIHFQKGARLYGRYWGCAEHHPYLHFELCYYRAIEYAIEHEIDLVEAGAQGPQKTLRGFLPTAVHSAHWIADERFRDAIARYVLVEAGDVEATIESEDYDPYRHCR